MEQAFFRGVLAMGYALAGLFFLRFWRGTGDRLFAIFAVAFWLMAVQRCLLAFIHGGDTEAGGFLYLMRLFSYLLILIAIIDKNRSAKTKPPPKPTLAGKE